MQNSSSSNNNNNNNDLPLNNNHLVNISNNFPNNRKRVSLEKTKSGRVYK